VTSSKATRPRADVDVTVGDRVDDRGTLCALLLLGGDDLSGGWGLDA
jgi:hypothetical protein